MKRKWYTLLVVTAAVAMLAGCGKADQEQNAQPDTQLETEVGTEVVEETENEPVVNTVTISATGDCALGILQTHGYSGSFNSFYDANGEEYFLKNFKDIFAADDLTIVNLECVFTTETQRVEKTFNIKGKPEYTGILTSSFVEAVSLGNNHSSDYGPQSLVDTKNALDEAGVLYAINDTIAYYTTDEGLVVAMVSAGMTSGAVGTEQYLLSGIAEAKNQGADLIIASCHWGVEGDHYPNDFQRNLGHKLIDAGADLVIGNHPHVLQGMEEYNGKIIIYSLGNFSFGANRNPKDKNTAVYQQTFTFMDGVLQADITAKIIPSRISGHDTYNDYQPVIAEGEKKSAIIDKMNAYSQAYSGVYFDEQGNLLLKTTE